MLAILAAAAALSPAQQLESDVRCVVALVELANTASEKNAHGISTAALYFLGKVDGRALDYDLVAAAARLKADPDYNLADEAQRCAAEIDTRTNAISELESALGFNG